MESVSAITHNLGRDNKQHASQNEMSEPTGGNDLTARLNTDENRTENDNEA